MIFTNNPNDHGGQKCYYKFAFSDTIFSTLSDVDKSRLVLYTAQTIQSKIKVSFVDFKTNCDKIGEYNAKYNRLYINNLVLIHNMDPMFSYDLYSFIVLTLNNKKKIIKNKNKKNLEEDNKTKNKLKIKNETELLLDLERILNINNIENKFLISAIETSIINSYKEDIEEYEKKYLLVGDINNSMTRKM